MSELKIGGLQKSSLIDYPGHISAVVFMQGCNFRCPYCHNPELIETKASKEHLSAVLSFLKKRVGKLDAVVISGGEPCLQKGLEEFLYEIKDLGFLTKLDTNGSFPDVLKTLIDKKLLDYVAMDIKAPLDKYSEITCNSIKTANILKSLDILKSSDIPYEFRTTVVKSMLTMEDFEQIGQLIQGAPKYYLQKFVPSNILDQSFLAEKTYSYNEFEKIKDILKKYVNKVIVR